MKKEFIYQNSSIEAKEISIGENCVIGKNVSIKVRGNFILGRCSTILDNVQIECQNFIAGEYLFLAKGVEIGRGGSKNPEANVKIGDHVGIFENTIINPNSPITIGDDVGIGAESMLWTHGAWLDVTSGFPASFGPITIGDSVWLPPRCIMLPNTSIGDNTVIGIGSLVNKNIPAGCLAAGNPCKVIKQDVYPKEATNEELARIINQLLDRWSNVLMPLKIANFDINYDYNQENKILIIKQKSSSGIEDTIFDIGNKTISGYFNSVSEDLRDFLRRNGIKIYNGMRFKSI